MTKSYTAGSLNRFLKNYPRKRVCIQKGIITDDWLVCEYWANMIPSAGPAIGSYARERDAKRALRTLGYTQEVISWKPPQQAVNEPATPSGLPANTGINVTAPAETAGGFSTWHKDINT